MKRVKLINDPAELVALFRAVDSEVRRNVLSTLAEGWTMISDLNEKFGDEANDIIVYYEKFKLIESPTIPDGSPIGSYQCTHMN